jgi:hypothetical protein
VIDSGSSRGPSYVTVAPSDGAFETSGCKIWVASLGMTATHQTRTLRCGT